MCKKTRLKRRQAQCVQTQPRFLASWTSRKWSLWVFPVFTKLPKPVVNLSTLKSSYVLSSSRRVLLPMHKALTLMCMSAYEKAPRQYMIHLRFVSALCSYSARPCSFYFPLKQIFPHSLDTSAIIVSFHGSNHLPKHGVLSKPHRGVLCLS